MVVRRVGGVLLITAGLAMGSACAATPGDNGAGPTLGAGSTVVQTTTSKAPSLLNGTDITSSSSADRPGLVSLQLTGVVKSKLSIPNAICVVSANSTTISAQSGDGSRFNVTVLNPATGSWPLSNPPGKPQVQGLTVVVAGRALGAPASGNIAIQDAISTKAALSLDYGGAPRSQQLTASWSCKG